MPSYSYHAVDRRGVAKRGHSAAAHESELFEILRGQGLSLISCKPAVMERRGSRLPLADQAVLCRHIHAMLLAGIPVHIALGDVAEAVSPKLGASLTGVRSAIANGRLLSEAFHEAGQEFDPLFELLLKAGEKTGRLAEAFSYLQSSLEWKDSFQRKMRSALTYPFIQLTLAIAAVSVLMNVAVPQVAQLLSITGSKMPWYAEVLLGVLHGLGYLLTAVLAGGVVFFVINWVMYRQSKGWALWWDGIVLNMPLVGKLVSESALAQITYLFAAMIASGMQAMDALHVLPNLSPNRALAAEFARVAEAVQRGQSLSQSFESGMRVPAYVVRLLRVGEDGGDLVESLRHVSQLYQRQSEAAADALLKGASLGITLGVGLILAAIVSGVMYPLYHGLNAMLAN